MPIKDNDLLVYFGRYCRSCEHEKLEGNEPPYDECLEHPVSLNSRRPINYKDRSDWGDGEVRLRFIGKDGSMGLKTNKVYETYIFIRGKFLRIEWKINLFSVKSCPYSSTKAFAQNRELASTI